MRLALLIIALALLTGISAKAEEPVTVDNFVRAETDRRFQAYVDQGGFGKFLHYRQPAPNDKLDLFRMSRDTLYSVGVFDLDAAPVTIHKPDAGDRFQSIQVVNQDHFTPMVLYNPGDYTLTREKIGTRYVAAIVRTFVDANDPADISQANAIQDKTTASTGKFEIPDWDEKSRERIGEALKVLAATAGSTKGAFGSQDAVDPVMHLLYTAYGWGGNPSKDLASQNIIPEQNDGKTPHALTVKDVPVDGFWSITVYSQDGLLEESNQHVSSVTSFTAQKNEDGSITVNFGQGADAVNNIPIPPSWSYTVRLYRPHKEILDGTWSFPEAQAAE